MKISYNWLKEFLDFDLSATEISELLTYGGLEVEGLELFQSIPGGLKGLVIGEVLSCTRHPNADKLTITKVDTGTEILQIVCGAPNVAQGQKVVVALPGATLYPLEGEPFEIKKSKIRGELSEGMICAEDEIGIGRSHEGIIVLQEDAVKGMPAAEFYKITEDSIFEIGLTPNRADAASHLGVARDLYSILLSNGHQVSSIRLPEVPEIKVTGVSKPVSVMVEDNLACPRYSGLCLSGVNVSESPSWLQNKLRSIGLTPINNVVDITNLVLHECGQPLHAFDLSRIRDRKIVVRNAKSGEKFITLDGVERNLTQDDLMICDAGEPLCIAGVFGGANSGISESTTEVFLESACFNAVHIRKTSKHHSLKTDASFRFERGTDPEITVYALKRAADLICRISGAVVSSGITDIYPEKIEAAEFTFSFDYLDKFSGLSIDREKVKSILISTGIIILREEGDSLFLRIPAFKVDVTRPVDVVEEILRIYGYNRIPVPSKMYSSPPAITGFDPGYLKEKVSNYLASNGFCEILTNSLVPVRTKKDESENSREIRILNPLSQELGALRQDLLHNGLEVISYNRNRKNSDLRLFEFGKTYQREGQQYIESDRLSVFLSGRKFDISWNGVKDPVDFYFAKAFAENVLRCCRINISALHQTTLKDEYFSQVLEYKFNKSVLLRLGSLQKPVLRKYDIGNEVFHADFDWNALLKHADKTSVRVKEVSRYPSVRRDLSMMIDSHIHFSQIEKVAFNAERKLLREISLFDVYQGEKIEKGKKSYAVSFILLDENQTLTDKHIDKTMDKLMAALEKEVGAVIRRS
jgi:phenylalanyl-tRNA synthetase beta chain